MAPKLVYTGPKNFRLRVALSLLSLRPLTIRDIRSEDLDPGLKEYETGFLNLIDRLVIFVMSDGTCVGVFS